MLRNCLICPTALHLRQAGAELSISYVDEHARPHEAPLPALLEALILSGHEAAAPPNLPLEVCRISVLVMLSGERRL